MTSPVKLVQINNTFAHHVERKITEYYNLGFAPAQAGIMKWIICVSNVVWTVQFVWIAKFALNVIMGIT